MGSYPGAAGAHPEENNMPAVSDREFHVATTLPHLIAEFLAETMGDGASPEIVQEMGLGCPCGNDKSYPAIIGFLIDGSGYSLTLNKTE
jgi:hypothetical protein